MQVLVNPKVLTPEDLVTVVTERTDRGRDRMLQKEEVAMEASPAGREESALIPEVWGEGSMSQVVKSRR